MNTYSESKLRRTHEVLVARENRTIARTRAMVFIVAVVILAALGYIIMNAQTIHNLLY